MSEGLNAAPGRLRRLGIVMEPDLADPREAAGVLNPAVARGPDGWLSLLPRLVASGNSSRFGLVRVRCDSRGTPTRVERLDTALPPAPATHCRLSPDAGTPSWPIPAL